MKHFSSARRRRYIALFLLQLTLLQIGFPAVSWALTSGPTQPEFSSFEPVGTSDLVNKFTGDFTYTVPLMEVPGPQGSSYPLTLAYRSGANAEDEASWVGYGWNLNTGAINRSARGLPDDLSGAPTKYFNRVPDNVTVTVGGELGVELFSKDKVGAKASLAIRYNNYMGFGYNRGLGISLGKGIISLGVEETDSRSSYSASVNPMALLSTLTSNFNLNGPSESGGTRFGALKGAIKQNLSKTPAALGQVTLFGGGRGVLDFNEANRSAPTTQYSGESYNISIGATINPFMVPVGLTGNLSGSYSIQRTKDEQTIPGYGYLYAADAADQTDRITDYYREKDSPYNKRDVFLGVPFANADVYNATGEGVGGNFQVHHSRTGDFSPNAQKSEMTVINVGADISAGWTFGGGNKYKAGLQTLNESAWEKSAEQSTFSSPGNRGSYFRFANDLGGTVGNDLSSDAPVAAALVKKLLPYTFSTSYTLDKSSLGALTGQTAAAARGQGSHIGQHTVEEMERGAMFQYCKRADIDNLRYRPTYIKKSGEEVVQEKALGEFCVTTETGTRYTYGLPLYAKSESNLQYGLKGPGTTLPPEQGLPSEQGKNFLVYTDKTAIKVGEEREAAYATSYLLTDITTPDYVDRQLDGASDDDFGSFTSFYYDKKYGNDRTGTSLTRGWYHWRLPYAGHVYEPNSLSDPDDDMAAMSEGDKEVAYLKAVRTKTHTAFLITSERQDGLDASNAARLNPAARGSRGLFKLDRIELYANSDVSGAPGEYRLSSSAVPIKTVLLNYDYSLCQNTLNSLPGANNINPGKGKLTLVSVTTLYNGIQTAKPYTFGYAYPDYTNTTKYPDRYQAAFKVGYTGLNQNPEYDRFSMDAWGSYQKDGDVRYAKLQTWPSQKPAAPDFDPAAWQLKVIHLPSGGEIHVQYEQDDYAYVQDKTAHALAELAPTPGDPENEFLIDPSSVGIAPADVAACCALINKLYVTKTNQVAERKIFFKFLYKLVGTTAPASVTACNSDYISGYVEVREAGVEDGKIRIKIGKAGNDPNSYMLPRQVCWDFTQTQRLGKLQSTTTDDCSPATLGFDIKEQNFSRLIRQFAAWAPRALSSSDRKQELCQKLNPALSYFKIPLPTSKKGGGLRVKRLLTYDKGLDDVPVLYGSEYEYKAYDELTKTWRSSGVATTEPGNMRVENALVSYIHRLSQTSGEKAISGPDRKQSEGPIGESILPAAMVGYSRVAVKNIHSGKTNPGYSITEYFTCKDAPMQWRMTRLNRQPWYRSITAGFVNIFDNNSWATQGFSFILNNMHGQLKREATYAGSYDDINLQLRSALVSEQKYQYFNQDEKSFNPDNGDRIRLQDEPEDEGVEQPERVLPGKEVDVTTAQRAIRDNLSNLNLEGDLQGTPTFFAFLVWLTSGSSISRFNSEFYTHTTSKVIRYPAIVKQISSFHDGVRDTVENLAFDRHTGSPVAVRTSDGRQGAYLKQDVMASWVYPQMQGKSANENEGMSLVKIITLPDGTVTSDYAKVVVEAGASYLQPRDAADCTLLANIRKGDVLVLNARYNAVFFADVPDVARKRIRLYPYPAGTAAPTGPVYRVKIVASGNTNELRAKAGSTTYHKTIRRDAVIQELPDFVSNDALATALQTALRALPQTPSGTMAPTTIELPGPFSNMNVSGFADRIPSSCQSGATQAEIKNLRLVASQDAAGTTVQIRLMSFEMRCPGTSGGASSYVVIN